MPIIEEIEEIPEINFHGRRCRRRRRHGDSQHDHQTRPSPPQSHLNPKPIINSGTRKFVFVFLKWVIMTFILSLFLIFMGFAALVFLHFFLTTTAVRRRRRRRSQIQFPYNSITQPTSSLSIQDHLPCLGYSASAQTTRDCAICLDGFKEGDLCRKLPDCGHLFHVNCVDSWLTKKPNCPICRTRVQLDSGGLNNNADEWKFWWPVGA